jgi:CRISPR-associated Cas5-like protein
MPFTMTLSGPRGGFGDTPRLVHRFVQAAPPRSAIIGLIANAYGLSRDDDFGFLDPLKFRIIEQSSGEAMVDFQTVREAITVDGKPGRNAITYRYYLPDYKLVLEVDGPEELLQQVFLNLKYPYRPLYIGRRCNVLDQPVVVGDFPGLESSPVFGG